MTVSCDDLLFPEEVLKLDVAKFTLHCSEFPLKGNAFQ